MRKMPVLFVLTSVLFFLSSCTQFLPASGQGTLVFTVPISGLLPVPSRAVSASQSDLIAVLETNTGGVKKAYTFTNLNPDSNGTVSLRIDTLPVGASLSVTARFYITLDSLVNSGMFSESLLPDFSESDKKASVLLFAGTSDTVTVSAQTTVSIRLNRYVPLLFNIDETDAVFSPVPEYAVLLSKNVYCVSVQKGATLTDSGLLNLTKDGRFFVGWVPLLNTGDDGLASKDVVNPDTPIDFAAPNIFKAFFADFYEYNAANYDAFTVFEIYTPQNLVQVAALSNDDSNGNAKDFSNKTIKLMKNIDMASVAFDGISAGNSSHDFKGSFDGNGKIITNLRIYRPNDDLVGLIGKANNADIRSVRLGAGSSVVGKSKVGGIIGYASGTDVLKLISFNSNSASVTGETSVGGIVGYLEGSSSAIDAAVAYSYNTGTIWGKSEVGGIAGSINMGAVNNTYNTGSVTATDDKVGGIGGHFSNNAIFNYNYNVGPVSCSDTSKEAVGSIAGKVASGGTTSCYYLLITVTGNKGIGEKPTDMADSVGHTAEAFGNLTNLSGLSDTNWKIKSGLPVLDTRPVLKRCEE